MSECGGFRSFKAVLESAWKPLADDLNRFLASFTEKPGHLVGFNAWISCSASAQTTCRSIFCWCAEHKSIDVAGPRTLQGHVITFLTCRATRSATNEICRNQMIIHHVVHKCVRDSPCLMKRWIRNHQPCETTVILLIDRWQRSFATRKLCLYKSRHMERLILPDKILDEAIADGSKDWAREWPIRQYMSVYDRWFNLVCDCVHARLLLRRMLLQNPHIHHDHGWSVCGRDGSQVPKSHPNLLVPIHMEWNYQYNSITAAATFFWCN
jgi:hypothetical protein